MTSLQMSNFTSANRCYLKNVTALLTSMECWATRLFATFKKDPLLVEIQAKTSKSCRILLFQHHFYMVTLRTTLCKQINFSMLVFRTCVVIYLHRVDHQNKSSDLNLLLSVQAINRYTSNKFKL